MAGFVLASEAVSDQIGGYHVLRMDPGLDA